MQMINEIEKDPKLNQEQLKKIKENQKRMMEQKKLKVKEMIEKKEREEKQNKEQDELISQLMNKMNRPEPHRPAPQETNDSKSDDQSSIPAYPGRNLDPQGAASVLS